MPDQPMSEVSGMPQGANPVDQFRAWSQSQTTMGPNMSHTQAQPGQAQPQQRTDHAAQSGGKKASLKDLGNSIQNIVQQVGQKQQQRKSTEQQHLFDRFTQSSQGIQQAQAQLQEAQEAVKKNPQDQEAVGKVKQAQDAINQNKTILDAMFNGPHGEKNHKTLAKGFGIDDKNADTPERQNAIKAMQKAMGGLSEKPAAMLSQLPQTQQGQTPKPPTGNAMLQAETQREKMQQQQTVEKLRMAHQQGMSLDKLQMTGMLKGIDVSRGTNGELVTHVMSPEERAKVPYLKSQDDLSAAKTEAERAMADAKMNPNNPEMKIKMMDAQSKAVDANARMLSAQAQQMRAMTARAKEPPEVAQARKDADHMGTLYSKAQAIAAKPNPTPTEDMDLVKAWVQSQNPQSRAISPAAMEQALQSRSFGARISKKWEEATRGGLDPEFRQEMVDSIKNARDAAANTAAKYDVKKEKDAGGDNDDPLGILGK